MLVIRHSRRNVRSRMTLNIKGCSIKNLGDEY